MIRSIVSATATSWEQAGAGAFGSICKIPYKIPVS